VLSAGAGDEVASVEGGDDSHGIGVAEHPGATGCLDGVFENGEHEACGAGDACGDGWEAVFAGVCQD
jgi:hypothetical protein